MTEDWQQQVLSHLFSRLLMVAENHGGEELAQRTREHLRELSNWPIHDTVEAQLHYVVNGWVPHGANPLWDDFRRLLRHAFEVDAIGRPPEGATRSESIGHALSSPFENSWVPESLEMYQAIIEDFVADRYWADPVRHYSARASDARTIASLVDDLERFLTGEPFYEWPEEGEAGAEQDYEQPVDEHRREKRRFRRVR
jgi:hypothetical protein